MGTGASAAAFEKFEDGVPVAVGGDEQEWKRGDGFQPVSSETSTKLYIYNSQRAVGAMP